jgi:hypothetical protein
LFYICSWFGKVGLLYIGNCGSLSSHYSCDSDIGSWPQSLVFQQENLQGFQHLNLWTLEVDLLGPTFTLHFLGHERMAWSFHPQENKAPWWLFPNPIQIGFCHILWFSFLLEQFLLIVVDTNPCDPKSSSLWHKSYLWNESKFYVVA